jgi:hypothetical protein
MLQQNWQAEFAESLSSDTLTLEGVQPLAALHFYKNNYYSALVNTLKKHYPRILKMLGPDFFTITAKAYIEQYPSGSSSLNDYGAYFSEFLNEHEPVDHLIYLPELAQFEWACHEVALAAEAPKLTLPARDLLRTLNHDSLYIHLHPATRLMKCHTPLLKILQWCDSHLTQNTNLHEEATLLLLHRPEQTLTLTALSTADFVFLNRLHEGYSLSEAIAQTEIVAPLYNFNEKLNAWVDEGVIADINQA